VKLLRAFLKPLLRENPHPILDGTRPHDRDSAAAAFYDRLIEGTFLRNDEEFVRGRFRVSLRERTMMEKIGGEGRLQKARILDVGAGNGAFELALSSAGYFVVSIEQYFSPVATRLVSNPEFQVHRVVARAEEPPFKPETFDLITCRDAVEHFRNPIAVGRAVMTVAKGGALIFITTPPRLRYLLRRDPHYNIRFLAALPTKWQHRLAARHDYTDVYHTERLYWSARGIARLFPGSRVHRVLSRWKLLRNYLFDEIVLEKPHQPRGPNIPPAARER